MRVLIYKWDECSYTMCLSHGNSIFSHVSRPFCMCKNVCEETNVCCAIALNQGLNVQAISTALVSALLQ